MNDPVLREKFVEKYNGLRHSGSDQTLPQSFWSSKYGDRRTHANTYMYNTPLKSDKDTNPNMKKSPRFTQYSNTDFIGDEGQINDEAAMVRARNQNSTHIRISDTENSKIKTTPHRPSRNERNQYYGDNFSFLGEKKLKNKADHGYQKYDRVGRFLKSVDIDDNENDLINEGEENIEKRYLKDENISDPPYVRKDHDLGNISKSYQRVYNQVRDNEDQQINSIPADSKEIYSQNDPNNIKHSSSQQIHYQDESDVDPANDDEHRLSSKPLEEMKINKTAMYNLQNDIVSSDKDIDMSNYNSLNTPKKQKQTQYLERKLNKDTEIENPIQPEDFNFNIDNTYNRHNTSVKKSSRNEFVKKDSRDVYSSHESSRHIKSNKLNKKRSQKYAKINMTQSGDDSDIEENEVQENIQKRYYKSDKKPMNYNNESSEQFTSPAQDKKLDKYKNKSTREEFEINEGDLAKSVSKHYKNQIQEITKPKNLTKSKNSNSSSKL